MIRVVLLDHHPAMRAGLEAVIGGHADVVPVGAAADDGALWPLLYRTDPDVVLAGTPRAADALRLCLAIRARHPPIRVVVYAPEVAPDLLVPAAFAGAHALVDKSAGLGHLLEALRAPEPQLPPLTPRLRRAAAERLGHQDRAILAMRLAGTSARDIGAVVGLGRNELAGRCAEIVGCLCGPAVAVGALHGVREVHA